MNPRLWKERTTVFILYGLTGCGGLVLAVILTTVIMKGAPALSGEFLFEESRNFGLEGGSRVACVDTGRKGEHCGRRLLPGQSRKLGDGRNSAWRFVPGAPGG